MPTPPRRWFAFRLRTLFVAAVPLCAALAWFAYSLNWIRQRHEALGPWHYRFNQMMSKQSAPARAPGGLWIFGEDGFAELGWSREAPASREAVERLFPEAKVYEMMRAQL